MRQLINTSARFLVVVGLMSLSFIGGMTTRTTISVNATVTSGAEAASYERQIEVLSSALPMPKPVRKPTVRK